MKDYDLTQDEVYRMNGIDPDALPAGKKEKEEWYIKDNYVLPLHTEECYAQLPSRWDPSHCICPWKDG